MSDTLSPAKCADAIVTELLRDVLPGDRPRRERVSSLVRQLALEQFEQCARIAEQYVPDHDLGEDRTGLEVGDAIAESIRRLADG